MSTVAGRPAASACTACARPISPPSEATAALSAMFCALNGATRRPARAEQPAQAGDEQALAHRRRGPLDHDGARGHACSSASAARSRSRSGAGRTATRTIPGQAERGAVAHENMPREEAPPQRGRVGAAEHQVRRDGRERLDPEGAQARLERAPVGAEPLAALRDERLARDRRASGRLRERPGRPGRAGRVDRQDDGLGREEIPGAHARDGVVLRERSEPEHVDPATSARGPRVDRSGRGRIRRGGTARPRAPGRGGARRRARARRPSATSACRAPPRRRARGGGRRRSRPRPARTRAPPGRATRARERPPPPPPPAPRRRRARRRGARRPRSTERRASRGARSRRCRTRRGRAKRASARRAPRAPRSRRDPGSDRAALRGSPRATAGHGPYGFTFTLKSTTAGGIDAERPELGEARVRRGPAPWRRLVR